MLKYIHTYNMQSWPGEGAVNLSYTGLISYITISFGLWEWKIYKTFDLLQLKDIYNLELAKFMHKVHHNTLPKSLCNMFIRIDSVHRYPTLSSRRREFFQHSTKTASYKKWISTAGTTLWGNIQQNLKNENYESFSQKYRNSIINAY